MIDQLNDDRLEKLLDANALLLEKLQADTRRDEEIGALRVALDNAADTIANLQRIAADLNAANVALKQQIARTEATDEQPVFWRTDL